MVDGSTSATLWTRFHRLQDFPRVLGDRRDRFINNNCGIHRTFPGFKSRTFSKYMVLAPDWTTYRQERAEELFRQVKKHDLDSMLAMATDKSDGHARYAVPLLAKAWKDYGSLVPDPRKLLPALVPLLSKWNRAAETESREMTLFKYWFTALEAHMPGLFERPNFFPRTFDRSQGVFALEALLAAYGLHESKGFPSWGEIHRIHRATGPKKEISFPVGGDASALRATDGRLDPSTGYTIRVIKGQTCPMLVQVGPSAEKTRILYSKALDNCFDRRMPGPFSTLNTREWAGEKYASLFTRKEAARAGAVRVESLAFSR